MTPLQPAAVVLCTVGSEEDAERLAHALLEQRLAACVNVVPGVVSLYRWKGRIERDEERLLIIKTCRSRLAELQAAIVALHPYELPEVLALPVEVGHGPYLEWLQASTLTAV